MQDILIVEDDTFLRRMCLLHLEKTGRTIRVAKDGAEAMRLIAEHQPDLLLLDLVLPHVDGFTVLEFVQEKGYTFPVIVLSNVVWHFDRRGSRAIGVEEYIVKSSVDIPELVRRIERHLPEKDAMGAADR